MSLYGESNYRPWTSRTRKKKQSNLKYYRISQQGGSNYKTQDHQIYQVYGQCTSMDQKRVQGVGAGVVLISPQGDKLKYVLRMSFPQASNKEAEYEALLHGMKMANPTENIQGLESRRPASNESVRRHQRQHDGIQKFILLSRRNLRRMRSFTCQ
jgi:hypothetical protein